jgi:transcriptional regulator with XRE-family HTH domain
MIRKARYLNFLRAERGLPLWKVARLTKIDILELKMIENMESEGDENTWRKLAEYYGVTVETLKEVITYKKDSLVNGVKAARLAAGLTREELAKLAGVSVLTVVTSEDYLGFKTVSDSSLGKLAHALKFEGSFGDLRKLYYKGDRILRDLLKVE